MQPGDAPSLTLERMTSLDALNWAWLRVRENGGAAGTDFVTVKRFETNREANLLALGDEVREGSYQPGAIRFVSIPKPGKVRRLAILTVRDRVLQRAALDLLGPRIEPQFLAASFGYRPNLSLHDAVARIVRLRNRGLTTVLDADIRLCFESLDHTLLREALDRLVPDLDRKIWRLIDLWLAAPAGLRRDGSTYQRTRGVLQGAPLSPLFCNIYLHGLDASLARRRLPLVRYADDFVVLCNSPEHGERAHRAVRKVLAGLKLELHPGKTSLTSFEEGFDFLGVRFKDNDLRYDVAGTTIVSDDVPPEWFHYGPEGYD